MTLEILIDPIVEGNFLINPIQVNGNYQTIKERESFGELSIGSSFNGSLRAFDSSGGDGGSVTLSSVKDNELKGSFSISMLELVGGSPPYPKINVVGTFTATKR